VKFALSEEQPVLKEMRGDEFLVTFDPLDGSSIISVILLLIKGEWEIL
jgi:fructose-1,6-bisphosphatase